MKEINIFLGLIKKVNLILGDGVLITKYQALINAINSNQITNDIVGEIDDFNLENNIDFPYEFQKKFSSQLMIDNLFGYKANEKLNEILSKGKSGVEDIQKIINILNKIKGAFNTIYTNFNSLELIDIEDIENPYLEIIFDGKQKINSLGDFNKYTNGIEKHIKNLSKLSDTIIDSPNIEYISKNSPLDIAIYLGDGVVVYLIFDFIVQKILDRIIQVEEIRKMQLDIENKKMINDKIKEGLDEQIKEKEKDFSDNLSKELFKTYEPKQEHGAKNEIIKGTKDAINFFNKIIVNGGIINIGILPSLETEGDKSENKYVYNNILEKNNKKNTILNEVIRLSTGDNNIEEK